MFVTIDSHLAANAFPPLAAAQMIEEAAMADAIQTLAAASLLEVQHVALVATSLAILIFAWYTLRTTPEACAILMAILILAWVVEAVWKWYSKREIRSAA